MEEQRIKREALEREITEEDGEGMFLYSVIISKYRLFIYRGKYLIYFTIHLFDFNTSLQFLSKQSNWN